MPKISQKQVKDEDRLVRKFWDDINAVSPAERMTYFEHLLTPTEVMMLTKRAVIFKDLINKRSYNEISTEYGVGVNTISRLSNTLHQADPDFIVILTKLGAREERKGIFG
ncbi:MAG: Trp family transcriptional regulator [candidate division WWE3 bacterium]|nr:Trp family transcriptional regulator [candidate division WWE3 bacterium]